MYPLLSHPVFSDTMITGTVSKSGNKNDQVYGTYFGWTHFFPMKLEIGSHDTFTLLFNGYGVPPEMIMNDFKEKLSSDFCKKLYEANCHQNTI